MFKKIVKAIAEIQSKDDFNKVCGEIDTAYQGEKISWNDHELLYSLASKVGHTYMD